MNKPISVFFTLNEEDYRVTVDADPHRSLGSDVEIERRRADAYGEKYWGPWGGAKAIVRKSVLLEYALTSMAKEIALAALRGEQK